MAPAFHVEGRQRGTTKPGGWRLRARRLRFPQGPCGPDRGGDGRGTPCSVRLAQQGPQGRYGFSKSPRGEVMGVAGSILARWPPLACMFVDGTPLYHPTPEQVEDK